MANAIFEKRWGDPDTRTSKCTNYYNIFNKLSKMAYCTIFTMLDNMEIDNNKAEQAFH